MKENMGETAKQQTRQSGEPEGTGADLAVVAAGVSVLLSWYEFFGRRNQIMGLFIGLWPPTILAFASYLKQKSMADRLERTVLAGSTMRSLRKLLE